MKLLIADDSAHFRMRLLQMLSQIAGVQIVQSACNGYEAIAYVRKLRPDVAILDIQMPGANGIEVLEEIKRDFPETKVIMLTGHHEPQYEQRCIELGADHFFPKSSYPKDMVRLITEMTNAWHGRGELIG